MQGAPLAGPHEKRYGISGSLNEGLRGYVANVIVFAGCITYFDMDSPTLNPSPCWLFGRYCYSPMGFRSSFRV